MLASLFRKKPPAPDPHSGPQLCMVCLKGELGLTPDRIIRAWAKFFPTLPPITHKAPAPDAPASPISRGDSAVIQLSIGTGPNVRTVMVAVIPVPITNNEISDACATSWMWPNAEKQLAAQKAHAIVACTTTDKPIDDALAVSRIATCVAAAGEGLGIYWGSAGLVHKPKDFLYFLNSSIESDVLPVMLWVGLRVSSESSDGPHNLTTHGLDRFGHRELEILKTHMPPGDLRTLAFDALNYLLHNGPIIKHNQTFGRTPQEQFQVEHTTSTFRQGEPVLRLHVP